jgi:hypothetical protein
MSNRLDSQDVPDGFTVREPVKLPDAVVQQWFATASPSCTLAETREALDDIATDHRRWCAQEGYAVTRAKANAALRLVAQTATELRFAQDDPARKSCRRRLEMLLRGLNNDAHWLLARALAIRTGDDRVFGDINLIIAMADLLPEAAVLAIDAKPGPRPDNTLHLTTIRLLDTYDKLTGRRWTHTPRERTEYDGRPHSEAGTLVTAFFDGSGQAVRPTAISRVLASCVARRSRREAAREQP